MIAAGWRSSASCWRALSMRPEPGCGRWRWSWPGRAASKSPLSRTRMSRWSSRSRWPGIRCGSPSASAGARLRALAVELAGQGSLEVSAVAYEDESLELEVALAGDPLREPVSIGRDKTGGHCLVSLERWAGIGDDGALEKTAQMIAAVAIAMSCVASG